MPALAIAQALRGDAPDVEPVLIGAVRGVEARILPTRDFRFHLLPPSRSIAAPGGGTFAGRSSPGGSCGRCAGVREEQPVAVLGTGGYASAPVVWWATRHGIPTAMQEQNAYPGLATRWLSRRVGHVYLGLPEARSLLRFGPRTEVFDTGNPITPPAPEQRTEALARFGLDGSRPVILVTGGSQGRSPSIMPSLAGSTPADRGTRICSG